MRVVFMGTPDFAIDSMLALKQHHDLVAVITQTDKPSGRGKKVTAPAVKIAAQAEDIPVYQFTNINSEEAKDKLYALQPDIIVVVAYGQILKPWLLTLPKYGAINVHASLLPRWRGASPIQMAIVAGDTQSGVTIMQMDKGLDTGPMLGKISVSINAQMTGGQLHDILKVAGAKTLIEAMRQIENGTVIATPQDDSQSSYAPLISKAMCQIDWTQSANAVVDLIRGFNPWPVAFSVLGDKRIKCYQAHITQIEDTTVKPGTVVAVDRDYIYVQTGKGVVALSEIQAMGSKRMSVASYLLGNAVQIGQVFTAKTKEE